jgi:hypothetical protein
MGGAVLAHGAVVPNTGRQKLRLHVNFIHGGFAAYEPSWGWEGKVCAVWFAYLRRLLSLEVRDRWVVLVHGKLDGSTYGIHTHTQTHNKPKQTKKLTKLLNPKRGHAMHEEQ